MPLSTTLIVILMHPLHKDHEIFRLPVPGNLWGLPYWTWDTSITLPLFVSIGFYVIGMWRRGGKHLVGRHVAFVTGWLSLFMALVSPLHRLGDVLFSAHMLQHEILVLISAPFLAASHPAVTFLYVLPASLRRKVGNWIASIERSRWVALMLSPLFAWLAHAMALWLWHVPSLYQATLDSDTIHAMQHLSFFATAVIFWSALYGAGKSTMGYGAATFYVFGTAVHSGALGALLTFSSVLWYPIYASRTQAWHLTPFQDQQLGGLIMWVPSSIVFIVVGILLFRRWVLDSEVRVQHTTVMETRLR